MSAIALPNAGLRVSAAIHLGFAGATLLLVYGLPHSSEVEMTIIDAPVAAPQGVKAVALERPKPAEAKVKPKGVFGVSPKSAPEASAPSDVGVKAGNTIAKAPDQDQLKPGDADSLPIPADEFLVTQMPKLLSEVRVAYPPEAKKQGVQGAVVMDLLIDGEGRVREARLLEGPGNGLNEAALEAARGFRFVPAKIEDKTVAVRIRYAYRFVLER